MAETWKVGAAILNPAKDCLFRHPSNEKNYPIFPMVSNPASKNRLHLAGVLKGIARKSKAAISVPYSLVFCHGKQENLWVQCVSFDSHKGTKNTKKGIFCFAAKNPSRALPAP